jgi:cytochrome c-type biogenesis protein
MNPATANSPAPSWAARLSLLLHAALFVLGFSLVFVVLFGGTATLIGDLLFQYRQTLAIIGGGVVIVFGLATLRLIKIPWLYYDTRRQYQRGGGGLVSSLLMGLFFAAGWSPCMGPTLGAIILLGYSQETTGQAMVLASGYALGLGVPFLLIALGLGRATALIRRFRKHLRTIEIVNGLLLIAIGLLLMTNRLTLIASWALSNGLYLDLPQAAGGGLPSYGVAVAAGLLSFLSPCVLPLVPAYIGYLGGHALGSAAIPGAPPPGRGA